MSKLLAGLLSKNQPIKQEVSEPAINSAREEAVEDTTTKYKAYDDQLDALK